MGPGGGGAAFSAGVSNLGNTMGQTGLTGTQLVLAGIGNLTLSQLTDLNGGTISISGGSAGAQFSLGVSGGNTAGDTGVTGTRVALAGGNGITLSQATDINGGTITVSGITQSVQTQDRFDLTLDGNTAGVLALVSSGTLTLAGGNNVTLSQNGNAITISGPSTVAQTVQTQNVHNVTLSGNTAGVMAQISSGTITLAGGNNITLSQNGNAVTISGAAGGAETQTGISGIAASNTTYTSGTVTFTGVGGGVTISSNTGQRIDISVAAPVAQTNQAGSVFAVGNTTSSSSGTYDARTLSLRGDGIISIAATNSGFRISATQSNQAGSLFAVGNTTSSSSGTFDARSMSIRGDGIISVAATNSGWRISATESVQTQNLHNVTLSGNTAGAMAQVSSGTMTLAGGNNITLSQAGTRSPSRAPTSAGRRPGFRGSSPPTRPTPQGRSSSQVPGSSRSVARLASEWSSTPRRASSRSVPTRLGTPPDSRRAPPSTLARSASEATGSSASATRTDRSGSAPRSRCSPRRRPRSAGSPTPRRRTPPGLSR